MRNYRKQDSSPDIGPEFQSRTAPRILLIEDAPGEAELFCAALFVAWKSLESASGLTQPKIDLVRTAQAGLDSLRQAIELRNCDLPDLIVLDFDLPLRDSVRFLQELKEHPRLATLPVIVMAWSVEESTVRSLGALGVAGYVVKPMRFDDLVMMVGDFCARILPSFPHQDLHSLDRGHRS